LEGAVVITPEDIKVELGRSTSTQAEEEQWQRWIDEARYLIGKRLGDIALLNEADVDYVVLHAVADHAKAPDNATQVDVAVDDARVSRRYSSGSGRVTILDEWWYLLDPDLTTSSSVGSTQMYGEPDTTLESVLRWPCSPTI
jgi:hypothetical protein